MRFLDPFTLLMLCIVALAALFPAHGGLASTLVWVGRIGVAGLFFSHGAALSRASIINGLAHWRLHLLILGATFGLFPLVVTPLSWLAPALIPTAMATGFLYLGALPSAVTSSIVFTSVARGNVPAAICAAAASNVFGMMATPFVFMLLAHSTGSAALDLGHAFAEIGFQLLAPFVAGQLVRPWLGEFLARHAKAASRYDKSIILIIVYTAFSQFVASGHWQNTPALTLALALLLCASVLAAMLGLTVSIARCIGLARADEIALLFCGSKKSLASGLPMANVLFAGQPGLGLIILPIMIYNQMQIIVCSFIARHYERRHTAPTARASP